MNLYDTKTHEWGKRKEALTLFSREFTDDLRIKLGDLGSVRSNTRSHSTKRRDTAAVVAS